MAFTYQLGANPAIDYPRLMVGDTVDSGHIFEDGEITAAAGIVASVFQSAQRYTFPGGSTVPTNPPTSYFRTAAMLLDALAANKARSGHALQALDIKLDSGDVSKALRAQAQSYRDQDDESGAFMIIEMVQNQFGMRDRFWATIQRSQAA